MPKIIQFFHPGYEHGFDNKNSTENSLIKMRNYNPHKRKFMKHEGTYIDKNGKNYEKKQLLFWGEWEEQSKVKILDPQFDSLKKGLWDKSYPQYLHFPSLPPDAQFKENLKRGSCQSPILPSCIGSENTFQDPWAKLNTDPCVFGDSFIYGICQQPHYNFLRYLEPGALIVFGSYVKDRFAIDTVFVVKDRKQHHPDGYSRYTGAFYIDGSEDAMFSFVPAKIYCGEDKGFPRFSMSDDFYKSKYKDYFQSSQGKQGVKGAQERTIDEVKDFWNYLKKEVLKEGYVLGVHFEIPKIEDFSCSKNEDKNSAAKPKNVCSGGGGCC